MRAELYTVAHGGPSHLSVLAWPRGGEWLPDEVQGWRTAGVDVVFSLLTPSEGEELELTEEAALCRRAGMTFIAFPLADRSVPVPEARADPLVAELVGLLTAGEHVAIHCRMGIGRSAMLAAATLIALGQSRSRHWLRWPLRVAVPSLTRPNSASGSSAMPPATSLPERSLSPESGHRHNSPTCRIEVRNVDKEC
jgi:hypothetical protein